MPRIDIIHQNVTWQQKYRYVSFAHTKVRSEVRGGGRKPWPQKGNFAWIILHIDCGEEEKWDEIHSIQGGGRARHGSIRSPLFRKGGVAHGPRSPTSHFYMLPFLSRVHGLTSTLSVKMAQNDLHVVNDLEIPTEDPEYIKNLMEKRKWGPSLLMIDTEDIIPEKLAISTDRLGYVNVMPAYGLNVYSMLKHDTLVMTTRAVKYVEDKILYQLHRNDCYSAATRKFRVDYQ